MLNINPRRIIIETSTNIIINNDISTNDQDNNIAIISDQIENVFIDPSCIQQKTNKPETMIIIKPAEYFNNPAILDTYKIPELRNILKFYKEQIYLNINCIKLRNSQETNSAKRQTKELYDFALVGTRQKLAERVIHFFNQNKAAIPIQKRTRGIFVRTVNNLRGPASRLTDRKKCVNDTDFYSLEPLENIPVDEFYSFTGANGFIYGCELASMIKYINNRFRRVNNPYTRESIDQLLPEITRLNQLIKIIQKPAAKEFVQCYEKKCPKPTNYSTNVRPQTPPLLISAINRHIPNNRDQHYITANPIAFSAPDYNMSQMIAKTREMRAKPFADRVQGLFMEIDQLGHYTQAQWFMQLERRDYIRYFRTLQDIWRYRAQLSYSIKQKICPLWDPFVAQSTELSNYMTMPDQQLQNLCITVMEDMVCTGIDNDSRMLGAFHVLSALTIVSPAARASMMWLYESLVY